MSDFDPFDDGRPRSPIDDVADNTEAINQELWKIRQEIGSISSAQMDNQRQMLDQMQSMTARLSEIRDLTRNAMWILAVIAAVLVFK